MRASWTMLLAAGPLALWGAWALRVSLPQGRWIMGMLAAVAVATAIGLLRLTAWARPLAYAFAAWLVLACFYAVGQEISRGWPYADWLRTVLSLVLGALLLVVCVGGSWVVHTQYRQHARDTTSVKRRAMRDGR